MTHKDQGPAPHASRPAGARPLAQPNAAAPSRSLHAQRFLSALALVLVLAGAITLAVSRVLYGVAILVAASFVIIVLVQGAGKGREVLRIWFLGRKPDQDGQPKASAQHDGVREQEHEYAPQQAHPGAPQQVPPGGPEHHVRAAVPVGQDHPEPADPSHARPSVLPPPPAFGTSTAGQAPWLLPGGSAPAGLAADGARLGDLDIRAASMVGAGHRCEEPADPRQDAYALSRTPDGQYLIIAVADGVGSSKYADLGARVAVSTATRELTKMLASGPGAVNAELLFKMIAGEMAGTARSRGLRDEDVCSILIVAAIPTAPRHDGTRTMWVSWIGDVSLWIHRDGVLQRFTGEEKSGLDRNALPAVLPFSPDFAEKATVPLQPNDRVAVMTDGLSDSMRTVSGVTDFFTAQWAGPPPHPAVFLHSLCYDGPGQTDDRTAVVVWCGAQASARSGASARRQA